MSFLNPIFLFGFLALTIPIIIHLWNRQKSKVIKVGTTRFIKESSIRRARQLKLTQVPLLLVRLILLSLLVLVLSHWVIRSNSSDGKTYLVYEKEMRESRQLAKLIDSLEAQVYRSQDISSFRSNNGNNFWDILPQIEREFSDCDSLIVVSYAHYADLEGPIYQAGFPINWVIVPEENQGMKSNKFLGVNDNEYLKYQFNATTSGTEKKFDFVSSDEVRSESNRMGELSGITIGVLSANQANDQNMLVLFESAINTINTYLHTNVELEYLDVNEVDAISVDLLINLTDKDSIPFRGSMIEFKPYPLLYLEIPQIRGNKRVFTFPERLLKEPVTGNGLSLPERILAVLLYDLETDIPDFRTHDNLDESFKILDESSDDRKPVNYSETNWLWILIVLLFLTERIYSFSIHNRMNVSN